MQKSVIVQNLNELCSINGKHPVLNTLHQEEGFKLSPYELLSPPLCKTKPKNRASGIDRFIVNSKTARVYLQTRGTKSL